MIVKDAFYKVGNLIYRTNKQTFSSSWCCDVFTMKGNSVGSAWIISEEILSYGKRVKPREKLTSKGLFNLP
jgi:hypothetical protein